MSTPSQYVSTTSAATFEADVINRSRECVVLVDFWAPWCEPCRQLGPLLERLTEEYAGKIHLVKIDVDESPELAGAFGVQSIPFVVAMADGQPVDQFNGVMPEAQLREWLNGLVPSRSDELLEKGMGLEATDPAAAEACYREAAELSPEEDRLKIALARVILAQDREEEAGRIIAALEARGYLEPEAERIKSELQLRADAEEAGDIPEARRAVEAAPDDLSLQLKLAAANTKKHCRSASTSSRKTRQGSAAKRKTRWSASSTCSGRVPN